MVKGIKSLFISYLEGDISATDEKILIQWMKNNPDSTKEFGEYARIWELSEFAGQFDSEHLERQWRELLQKALANNGRPIKGNGLFLYWIPRIAAVFVLGALVSFFVSYQIFTVNKNELVFHEVSAPAGAQSKITLPDGTLVLLNAGSNVRYSNNYGKKNREINLTGEAYFDVVSNRSKIFVVKTPELNIKAYGTTFNVKSYPEENTVETTLIEGSIGVTRTKFSNKKVDEVILEPNQRVVYYKSESVTVDAVPAKQIKDKASDETNTESKQKLTYMISKGIDPEPFTSWKDGVLVIDSETLEELAVKLERKYNVNIHFEDDNLRSLKFSGELEDETLGQVIEAIGFASHLEFKIEDREIWIKGTK